MTFTPEQKEALAAPLREEAIKYRKNYGGGSDLAYLEQHHVVREANRIFGFDGWSRETTMVEQRATTPYTKQGRNGRPDVEMVAVSYMARVRITVGKVVREGCGYGDGQAAVDKAGSAHELAIKEAESDAMKRAFITFGDVFGLALYEKDKSKANVAPMGSQPPPPVTPRASKNDGTRALYTELQAEIDACGTDADALDILAQEPSFLTRVAKLPADWQADIRRRWGMAKREAKERPDPAFHDAEGSGLHADIAVYEDA